jgi:hypothetical protein
MTQVFWRGTTLPYGKETSFQAARIYAECMDRYVSEQDALKERLTRIECDQKEIRRRMDALIRRAAELLSDRAAQDEAGAAWATNAQQWLHDAGMEK